MSSYHGDAQVVIGEAEYNVTADLHGGTDKIVIRSAGNPDEVLDGLSYWGGHLAVEDDGVAWAIHEAGRALLRLPNGETASFIASGGVVGATRVDITGSGPAPFNI